MSFEKGKRVLTKDPLYWPSEIQTKENPDNKNNILAVYFDYKDFIRAFDIMATPDVTTKKSSIQHDEAKAKFFSKLHKVIERLNSRSVANTMSKAKSPNTHSILSGKSTPEVFGSTGAATYGKKAANNSVLIEKRPVLKKKLNQKLTDANTIKNVYINNFGLKKNLLGFDRKSSKLKVNRKLRKGASKNTHKRREYKLIDLTLNQQDENALEDGSEFNFTTTESSLPPLDRSSNIGSEADEDAKHHERYSRSHERAREPKSLQPKLRYKQRKTMNEGDCSKERSIIINETSITLANGNKTNMRSDILNIKKDFSFDKHRDTSTSETK